ncbi:MAG TPA: ThiF family adenylyltransferase, partial [Candidatus Synoicihabitans sp.]|nr:ThiF family adenylyltransferase [Candidatus Synoicihabitans sp.]
MNVEAEMTAAPLSDDYLNRFGGLARLYGRDALHRLHAAHVAVVGVGGVGSWSVEALARSGVGSLTLIDLDDVCVTNVNRQLPAISDNIGRPKVDALAERVRQINPACRVAACAEFFTASTAERLLASNYAVVIDAIDGTTAKATVIAACVSHGRRCVTVGGAGGKRDATQL